LAHHKIVLLSHADSDLSMLSKAITALPSGFPSVGGLDLQSIKSEQEMLALIESLDQTKIVVVRLLGRTAGVPGFTSLLEKVAKDQLELLVISGTGEMDPELACLSTVPPLLLQDAMAYFKAGGVQNLNQLLRLLSDRCLLTGFGYDPPVPLPEHGLYHPSASGDASVDLSALKNQKRPIVGITFYRAHWMSGNTAFIDALVEALEGRGLGALPVFTSSLRAQGENGDPTPTAFQYFMQDGKVVIDVLINTTSFAMADVNPSGPTLAGVSANELAKLGVPILQAICCNASEFDWMESKRGLSPLDTAMNVVIPEFDGRTIAVPISFKAKSAETGAIVYEPLHDRIERVVGMASRIVQLKHKPNREKRVAFVLTNSNAKASQIGNAVGLDAPASLLLMLARMKDEGYNVGELPETGTKLIHALIDRCSYDTTILSSDQCDSALGKVSEAQYKRWFDQLPANLTKKMIEQWGEPPGDAFLYGRDLIVSGLGFGNAVVVLQPPRGYGMDPNAIYHAPDLPPTHHYLAVYRWLRDEFGADAIVHVGKHGTLEWLPGKGVGLSNECFPDAFLDDVPLFYPFILNDPGEGSQAKRRAHAVIIDHLVPAMTTAETYGVLAELAQLVDEYYQVELLDPSKLPLLQQQIWDLVKKANLDKDLDLILDHDHDEDEDHHHDDHDHDDDHEHHHHDHDDDHHWNDELAPHGVPVSLAEMDGVAVSHLIQDIDGYLCELGAAQIRNGLHTLGQPIEGEALVSMLQSLTRLPNLEIKSLQDEIASYLGLDMAVLLAAPGQRLEKGSDRLNNAANRPVVTHSDALEVIDSLSKKLYERLQERKFDTALVSSSAREVLACESVAPEIERTLRFACDELVPNLKRVDDEIGNLMGALSGGYVPPGPSGSPTRGMAHILPTGRNFYSVDPRSLPSHSAWRVGQELANEVLRKHLQETGTYPENVSISVWGTSAMRTHGDDVAQILALIGVRPVWQLENRRVSGIEVIPLVELGRPRVDVTVRISGFFRDAFQHLIDLIDEAVVAVINLDEKPEQNFIRKHYLSDVDTLVAEGETIGQAQRQSAYRVFGSKPGSYGAGILPLINEKNWESANDFSEAYVNWGGYAYSRQDSGVDAKPAFRNRLSQSEIALHNQDNREHDIFDSDDYLQFHGGMIATIRSLSGRKPKHYFGDTQDPSRAVVRDLKEEALRVFRSRVVNPKWIESIQKHGYKGGLELTATVDYFFGYDATAEIMQDWMYEELAQTYAFDDKMRKFLSDNNPWAMNAIAERLLEAAQRKMWKNPTAEAIAQLKNIYLEGEAVLEKRAEKVSEVAR
jgi:cobaltochelatase CobN